MDSGPILRRADDTGGGGGEEWSPQTPPLLLPPPPPPPLPAALPHGSCPTAPAPRLPHGVSPTRAHLALAVLCFINLLNYMDRFTLASVLPEIEDFFGIGDSSSGLLQTAFIGSYLLLAPLFGYLGDRRSRRQLLGLGLGLWAAVTLGSSFVPRERFWVLLLGRALVGVGEASYSTIAPTLIADLYWGPPRSWALGIFYLAVPLGSGLGYIVGAKVKEVAADWRWALRVTPALGALALLLLVVLVVEPPRGGLETPPHTPLPHSDWVRDLKALIRNRSLVLSTLGFTAVAFVSGALALWAPAYLYRCRVASGRGPPCRDGSRCHGDESLLFGVLTCASGVLGVGLGSELSRRLRPRTPRGDPLICGAGLLGAAPCLLLALLCAKPWPGAAYVFIFLGETLLALNWALVADILLDVVVPTRRATAEALQIVTSHLLGDAGSPYLIGVVSDALRAEPESLLGSALGLQRALLLLPLAGALGGGAFLATAHFLPRDRAQAQREAQGLGDDVSSDLSDDLVVPRGGRSTKVPVAQVLA